MGSVQSATSRSCVLLLQNCQENFRSLCTEAMEQPTKWTFNLIDQLYFSRRSGNMLNLIHMAKGQRVSTTDDMQINTLEQYYKEKFRDDSMTNTTTREGHSHVYSNYQNIEGKHMDCTLHKERLVVPLELTE